MLNAMHAAVRSAVASGTRHAQAGLAAAAAAALGYLGLAIAATSAALALGGWFAAAMTLSVYLILTALGLAIWARSVQRRLAGIAPGPRGREAWRGGASAFGPAAPRGDSYRDNGYADPHTYSTHDGSAFASSFGPGPRARWGPDARRPFNTGSLGDAAIALGTVLAASALAVGPLRLIRIGLRLASIWGTVRAATAGRERRERRESVRS